MRVLPITNREQNLNKGNRPMFNGYGKAFNNAINTKISGTYQAENMFFNLVNALKTDAKVELSAAEESKSITSVLRNLNEILDYAVRKSLGKDLILKDKRLAVKKGETHKLMALSVADGAITFHSPSDSAYIKLSKDKKLPGELKLVRVNQQGSEEMTFYDNRKGPSGLKKLTKMTGHGSGTKSETQYFLPSGEEKNYFDLY